MGYITHYKNGFQADEVNAFRDMLFVDTLRGFDATGVFSVDNKLNVALVKAAMEGPDFIRQKDFVDFAKEAVQRGSFLVGHNRAATKGAADKDENAHPFCVDDKIVLVQNGSWHAGSWKHIADTEVDTEAIAQLLAREPDIAKALQQINAAYALVWYDVTNTTLHIIRNNLRPLFVAKPKRGGIMFASEASTILYAAARQNIPLEAAPAELAAGVLISIKLEQGGGWTITEEKVDYSYRSTFRQESDNDDAAYDAYMSAAAWYNGRQHHPHYPQQRSWNRNTTHSTSDVDTTFRAVAIDNPKYHRTLDQVKAASEWINAHRGKSILVELEDFHKANSGDNCKAWFVVAKAVDMKGNDDAELPVFYWIIKDLDEVQVLDYFNTIYWEADMGVNLIEGEFFLDGVKKYLGYMPLANYRELTTMDVQRVH